MLALRDPLFAAPHAVTQTRRLERLILSMFHVGGRVISALRFNPISDVLLDLLVTSTCLACCHSPLCLLHLLSLFQASSQSASLGAYSSTGIFEARPAIDDRLPAPVTICFSCKSVMLQGNQHIRERSNTSRKDLVLEQTPHSTTYGGRRPRSCLNHQSGFWPTSISYPFALFTSHIMGEGAR